jgi:adenylate kinase
MKRRVVLLGPPGSGKGTIGPSLEQKFGLEHVSTGQWFRKEAEAGTELGIKVREFTARGELVPDEIVLGLLEHWLTPDLLAHGFLFDGFPRTVEQASALDRFCGSRKAPLEAVLYLQLAEDLILERITGRRVCLTCGRGYHVRNLPPFVPGKCDNCGSPLVQREDDRAEVVKKRLDFYNRVTAPVVDYYRSSGKLVSLNAALGSELAIARATEVLAS